MSANAISMPTNKARVLQFAGGCNFRDLGGYRTRSGRELKWGRVFRTGVLTYFEPVDRAPLSQLGVSAICDLRRQEEREREPTRWPDTKTELLSWDDGAAPTIRTLAASKPYTAEGMHEAMIDLYRALPSWMVPRMRDFFARLVGGAGPVLIHCAAGKDRTGIAIAVLLTALDVPYETILEDYLLTNTAGDFQAFVLSRQHAHLGIAPSDNPLLTLPEDIRNVLFSAHADYLQAGIDQFESEYGGVHAYVRDALGIDAKQMDRLHALLLE